MKVRDSSIKPPKASSRSLGRRAALALALALAAAIVGLGLWLALPPEKAPASRLLPPDTFAYATLRLDRGDPAVRAIVELVKDRLASGKGALRKAAVSALLPAALPPSITAVAGRTGPGGEASLIVFADLGRLSKLLRLAGSAAAKSLLRGSGSVAAERLGGRRIWYAAGADGRAPFSAYAFVGGTLVLGTSRAAVEACCSGYAAEVEAGSRRAAWGEALDEAAALRGAYLFAENADGALTRIVEAASTRFSFAAFPSIGSVASVNGAVQILEGEIKGEISFAASAGGKSEEIASDVQFIYGAAKRVARSAGLRLQGEVSADARGVGFGFSLPGYAEALAASGKTE